MLTACKALDQNEAEFDVDITCKTCSPEFAVTSVRQVVPLSRLSTRLQELISSRPRHHSHSDSNDSPEIQSISSDIVVKSPSVGRSPSIRPRPPSVTRTVSAPSNLQLTVPNSSVDLNRARSPPLASPPIGFLSITEELPTSLQWPFTEDQPTMTTKRASKRMPGFVRGFWEKSPHRPSSPAFVKPQYAFFADGKSILLWTPRRIGYCGVDSTSIIGTEMGGLEQAAGGSSKIGIVSLDTGVSAQPTLETYHSTHPRSASSASTST